MTDVVVERAAERLGALAAMQGKPYSANPYDPYRQDLAEAWWTGHHVARTTDREKE